MTEVQRVDTWKTSDGAHFHERASAETRQAQLDFIAWYRKNIPKLSDGHFGSAVKIWEGWVLSPKTGTEIPALSNDDIEALRKWARGG